MCLQIVCNYVNIFLLAAGMPSFTAPFLLFYWGTFYFSHHPNQTNHPSQPKPQTPKSNFEQFFASTVVPGFRALGFRALPGFRALKAGDGAWSVHKTLFGFRAPLSQLFIYKYTDFYCKKLTFVGIWMFFYFKKAYGLNFKVPSKHQDYICI